MSVGLSSGTLCVIVSERTENRLRASIKDDLCGYMGHDGGVIIILVAKADTQTVRAMPQGLEQLIEMISFNSHNNPMRQGILITSVLQMRK